MKEILAALDADVPVAIQFLSTKELQLKINHVVIVKLPQESKRLVQSCPVKLCESGKLSLREKFPNERGKILKRKNVASKHFSAKKVYTCIYMYIYVYDTCTVCIFFRLHYVTSIKACTNESLYL